MCRIGVASVLTVALVAAGTRSAAVPGVAAAGRGGGARLEEAASQRVPIRSGAIAVKVTDYDAARQQLLDAAQRQGAELLKSRTEVNYQGKRHGWLWFRVAADRLPLLLPAVRGVASQRSSRASQGRVT